jgi:hypothetical protein
VACGARPAGAVRGAVAAWTGGLGLCWEAFVAGTPGEESSSKTTPTTDVIRASACVTTPRM